MNKTLESSPLWKNPLIPMQERLQIADGAIAFRDGIIQNLDEEVERLTKLAYIDEHQHEDYTYKFRLEELRAALKAQQEPVGEEVELLEPWGYDNMSAFMRDDPYGDYMRADQHQRIVDGMKVELETMTMAADAYSRMFEEEAEALEAAKAENAKLREALQAADEYLSDNPFNEIGAGSILHRQMKAALAGDGGDV